MSTARSRLLSPTPNLLLRGDLQFVPGTSLNENRDIEKIDAEFRFDAIRKHILAPKSNSRSTLPLSGRRSPGDIP
jgi:hypothetical protein